MRVDGDSNYGWRYELWMELSGTRLMSIRLGTVDPPPGLTLTNTHARVAFGIGSPCGREAQTWLVAINDQVFVSLI